MAIDPAIDDQCGRDNRIKAAGLAQLFRQKRHLEGAGHVKDLDVDLLARGLHLVLKADQGLIDDGGMPAGLDIGDPQFRHLRAPGFRVGTNARGGDRSSGAPIVPLQVQRAALSPK